MVGGGGWAPYLEQHRREELYTYTYTHIIISLIHAHSTSHTHTPSSRPGGGKRSIGTISEVSTTQMR